MSIDKSLIKHRGEFQRALANHKYEQTDEGVLFPEQKVTARGFYVHDVNGQDVRMDANLLVNEGLAHMLDVTFRGSGEETQVSPWYFALFSGNVTPQATWTAANFTSNTTEITSGTEGYSESTRVAFVEVDATKSGTGTTGTAYTNNTASKAAFTIATTTSVTVWGAGLLSSNTKGGTSGILMSVAKFSAARTLYNTDVLNLGYTVTLTST